MVGSVNKDSVISIQNFLFKVLVEDFNVYKRLDKWREENGEEELVSEIKVNGLNPFIESLLEDEVIGLVDDEEADEHEASFLCVGDLLTFDDMDKTRARLPHCPSVPLLELVALSPQFDSSKAIGVKLDHTVNLVEAAGVDAKAVEDITRNLAIARLQTLSRKIEEEKGYLVLAVGDEDTPGFTKTQGLDKLFSFEAFVVPADASSVLMTLCDEWVEKKEVPDFSVHEISAFLVKGQPLRYQLREHRVGSEIHSALYPGENKPNYPVVQILLADENNLLPGEEGIDKDWFEMQSV